MNILIASDKFKGSLESLEAAKAISKGILSIDSSHKIVTHPLADGGDGSLAVLGNAYQCELLQIDVHNAAMQPIKANMGFNAKTNIAVLEMAEYVGLSQLPEHLRNPLETTSYGLGEAISTVANLGAETIIVGLGGSATNDGGAGMLAALGFVFLDAQGNHMQPNGGNLDQIIEITYPPDDKLRGIKIILASDVNNPICGSNGATYTYGAQKGATPNDLRILETNMYHYATRIQEMTGNRVFNQEGYGAAGGIPLSACELLAASGESGSTLIFNMLGLAEEIQKADVVITGEGKIDEQTTHGKAISPVVTTTIEQSKKLVLVCGVFEAEDPMLRDQTRHELSQVAEELNLNSFEDAASLCEEIGRRIAKSLE